MLVWGALWWSFWGAAEAAVGLGVGSQKQEDLSGSPVPLHRWKHQGPGKGGWSDLPKIIQKFSGQAKNRTQASPCTGGCPWWVSRHLY